MRALFALLLLAACCSQPQKPVPVPPPSPGPIDPVAPCQAACMRMQDLGCPGWRGSAGEDEQWLTADDVSCTQVCTDVEIEAVYAPGMSLHPDCVAAAASCEASLVCFR